LQARPNPRAKGLPLRVVSFNVLAEIYATKQQYPDCPMWALSWNYRKNNLLREIRQFNGDIISLQEVQADRFEDFFLPEMRKLGYEGLYKKKTRESMGREGKVDGCALFYRTSSLKLLEKYVIEFNDAAMAMAHAGTLSNKRSASPDELQKGLQRVLRDNIAQVVVLETVPHPSRPSQMPQRVCVCNTHITANPEFSDVKLWQTAMLLKEVSFFRVGSFLCSLSWARAWGGRCTWVTTCAHSVLPPVFLPLSFSSPPSSTSPSLLRLTTAREVQRDAQAAARAVRRLQRAGGQRCVRAPLDGADSTEPPRTAL